MPGLSIMGKYSHLDFGSVGQTPLDIIWHIIINPLNMISVFTDSQVKLRTIFLSFYNFSFLPLFSIPIYIIVLLEDIFVRFIYYGPQTTKWALVNHHASISAIVLPFAAIYGAKFIYRISKGRLNFTFLGFLLFFTTITQSVIVHAPVFSIFKKDFYSSQKWIKDNKSVIDKIPPFASLSAQNNLLPHLTHRDNIYRIPYGLNSEYIMVDLHDGPNKYAPLSYREMAEFVENLISTGRYSVINQKGDAKLLKRNFKTDISKSKYYNDTRYCYYSFEER